MSATATTSTSANSGGPTKKQKKGGGYQTPWVEKYRPKTLDDVVGNEETLVRLRAIAKDGNVPNLILSGPPGTGKTTSVHALARELLGDAYKNGVLELNASDARGIDVVRNRIKSFAMNKVTLPPGRHKIIILDEADSMTGAAQQALRRTMEIYSKTTRFCLACNISTKIIEAIQSRAAILRYSRLTNEQVLSCLIKVAAAEKVSYTNDGLEALLFTAEGDMRHALNNFQACTSRGGVVNQSTVFLVCDQPHPKILGEIIAACQQGNTGPAVRQMKDLWKTGYAASDIIGTLFKVTKSSKDLPEALKLEYLREIGFTHMRVIDGCNTLLQLLGLIGRLCQIAAVDQNNKESQ
ncbi:factor C subunit 2 [Seminavis robusta]|uniref:Factor C subunit 2 n=1 Tax=Seminavis robusta TaxID=568900 RepID=A0A9N8E8A9_9STRA|nr:factor C subunit 2 [Seminavis robusta]|eukprot:Sro730_g194110.1 factor C subunit 2 (352) ;mRNA; f:41398-42881